MGIVVNQSIKNTITTYIGFAIGAFNTLFLYTNFLSDEYYGLVGFVLSAANLMMPLMMFGVNNCLIKYYSSFKTEAERNGFLSLMLFLPLLIILPVGFIGIMGYETISGLLANKNSIIRDYTWHIYVVAVAMAYFEIFFAWSKVQLKSVFGNIMKEIFQRVCISFLLFAVFFKWISVEQFIYGLVITYALRMLIIKIYAFKLRPPKINFSFSFDVKAVMKYSFLIIIAGSVAVLLIDLDKFMLGFLIPIKHIAYYNVAIFIATVIAVPARAMHQITHPLTAKLLNENNMSELESLYKRSSLNLLIISGFIFILIVTNINQLYTMLAPEYTAGLIAVICIAFVKLIENLLGNNNAILFNSDYYRVILFFGIVIVLIAIGLNIFLIPRYGINGAAYATFIALILYAIMKIGYVKYKFNMQPFRRNTGYTFGLILILSLSFYFWDFNFHPLVNIGLKSILLSLVYGYIVYVFNFSEDITHLMSKIMRR